MQELKQNDETSYDEHLGKRRPPPGVGPLEPVLAEFRREAQVGRQLVRANQALDWEVEREGWEEGEETFEGDVDDC